MKVEDSKVPGAVGSDGRKLDSIIITLTAGAVLGLILVAQGRTTDKQFTHPMHSPNDRSRFATIRALGDHGTYAIDEVVRESGWDTIDKVRRPDDGHIYSSKPPLLPTLLAYEYRLIKFLSGGKLTFSNHAQVLVRTIVATVNLVPMVVFLILYSRLLDRLELSLWARSYAMAAAAGGTYLTGFSVTLNNHTIAAFSSFFALYLVFTIWREDRREWWRFAMAGLFASFTAVTELPASALLVALFLWLGWKDLPRTLCLFLPFVSVPLAGHFWTNYQVTGTLTPAYEKREWYDFEGSYWKKDPITGRLVGSKTDPVTQQVIIGPPDGIDNQYEAWPVYLFHMLLGHHGIFSLSPVFVFAFIGLARQLQTRGSALQPFGMLAAGLTLVLLVFYTFFAGQRNYGGMCNGLRWTFWLIPLWLMFLPEGLRWKESCPWFRRIGLTFLLISGASAFYATRNPWTRPWLQELMYHAGWIGY